MLLKDGTTRVTLGHYQEVLFKKMERGSIATVRAMSFSGVKVGKIKTVGFNSFQILEDDGEISTIMFDDLLDIE